jgi:hypothetical protein
MTKTQSNKQSNTDIFYKLLKKPKIIEQFDNTYLAKQTENLLNIRQTLNKKKLMINSLGKSVEYKPLRQAFITSDHNANLNEIFMTNFGKIPQKRYTKRTTVGRSTIISHGSNFRFTDVSQGERKKMIKLANELTIRNNNSIKVYCFTPKNNSLFSHNIFCTTGSQDVYKKSCYHSMFKRITFDKNYKRVQTLQNNINDCFIKNVSLPKL